MQQSRRRFIQKSLLSLPALGSLAACGGGAGAASGSTSPSAGNQTVPLTGGAGATPGNPSSTVVLSGGDPSQGLVQQGKALIPYSSMPKPAKLQPVFDPDFKTTKITRITDVKADWNSQFAVPVYPTTQAWNCDETLMILYVSGSLGAGGHDGDFALFDGKTYKFLTFLNINPADVEQWYWSTTEPTALFYVDNNQRTGTQQNALTKMTVTYSGGSVTTSTAVLHDFANDFKPGGALYSAVQGAGLITKVSGGSDPFAMSENNDLLGLGAYLNRNTSHGGAAYAAFTYRISTGQIGEAFVPGDSTVPQALPSGQGTYFYQDENYVYVKDAVTDAVKYKIAYDGTQHSDMLRNAAGDDIVAGPQFDNPDNSKNVILSMVNLTKGTGPVILIDEPPVSGTLLSGRAYKVPGWVGMAMIGCPSGTNGDCNSGQPVAVGLPQTYLDQEVLIANVDSGAVYRVGHHRSTGNYGNAAQSNYWAQPNVTMSPSGTRILFQSDWGDANPNNPVIDPNAMIDTYVMELPAYYSA
ncbi:MAG TPA: hypothetical protein PKE37_14610 [Thiomonas arsenitoxydans]|uniref:hypothetical protein n=1 Tax=Thiomonas TaxID=32012 RepID=UPI002579F9EC|nr:MULTISPECIES: hypothetical protein [Thiomonas]HML82991.1 hypothetical protein [Thiomonas arsenitoxydans]